MRNLTIQLPETGGLKDSATETYARLLNLELDHLRRDMNMYVSRVVRTDISDDATLTADNELVLASGTVTITLPKAASTPGKMYHIKNTSTGVITVEPDGDETIDDETSVEMNQYDCMDIVSDSVEWWIV